MSKRYPIPPTRLPFINAEIAQVNLGETPHLVSSVYGAASGGRLYFWNPQTRAQTMRPLPRGIPGAYMLKTGPDGRLYLGCGNGDLVRYDGQRDTFETLVHGQMDGICWGGAVTERYVLWNASHRGQPGAVGVYDHQAGRLVKVLAPLDPAKPTGLYGHRVIQMPDGKLLWSMNVPEAHLVLLDPSDLTVQAVQVPGLEGHTWTSCTLLNDQTVVVFTGAQAGKDLMYLLEYPSLKVTQAISTPFTAGVNNPGHLIGNELYRLDSGTGNLLRFHLSDHKWEGVIDDWTGATSATLGVWQGEDLGAVTLFGEALHYQPRTGETDRFELNAQGVLEAHALRAVPDRRLMLGAPFINQRFWTIDTATGKGRDQGRAAPGNGQVNQIVWDPHTSQAFFSSYTTATLTAYDPAKPTRWPENPRPMASARKDGQMRPMAMAHDGHHLWMATSPAYGTLGGALCRLDPATDKFDVWPHIVPDQKLNALVLDAPRRRLFFSTEIYADCHSAPPTQAAAVVAAFDLDRLVVIARRAMDEQAPAAHVLLPLPDGRVVLTYDDTTLLAWQVDDDSLMPWGMMPDGLTQFIPVGEHIVAVTHEHIGLYASDSHGYRFVPKRREQGARLAHVAGEALFYAVGDEVVELPLSELGL